MFNEQLVLVKLQDKLYWAIFTEYVQTHIVNADRPVEFFIEGTRSRVGKSIAPKYGLLQLLIEPYLRGNVYDMVTFMLRILGIIGCFHKPN